MLRLIKRMFIFLIFFLLCISCHRDKEKKFVIGFSQCVGDDLWRKQMLNELKVEASFYDNITLLIEDAQGNSELQVKQIQNLVNKKS